LRIFRPFALACKKKTGFGRIKSLRGNPATRSTEGPRLLSGAAQEGGHWSFPLDPAHIRGWGGRKFVGENASTGGNGRGGKRAGCLTGRASFGSAGGPRSGRPALPFRDFFGGRAFLTPTPMKGVGWPGMGMGISPQRIKWGGRGARFPGGGGGGGKGKEQETAKAEKKKKGNLKKGDST